MSQEALEALLDQIDWYGFLFTIAVFFAIGGEAAMHLWYRHVNKQLQIVLRAKEEDRETALARLGKEAADANARAAEANLALERLKTPRGLSQEQQTRMSDKLKAFAGTPFVLAVSPDQESIAFMSVVNDVLVRAGWKWEPAEHDNKTGLIITLGDLKAREWATSGITIGFREEGRARLLIPADTLATAFQAEGFNVHTGLISDTISNNPDAVYVVIGTKEP